MEPGSKVKPSEFDPETRGRLAHEVAQALGFLGDEMGPDEILRRVAGVLDHPEVDEILPSVIVAPSGKPWILPIVGDVLHRVMATPGEEPEAETAPPDPPEIDQSDSPVAAQHPSGAPSLESAK